ncbi:NAP family protein [Talaromyces proteolyticus]|uniref:NAP family protein n=1 Tax=Talaromyces proteolyticus TaxID=1131652 RepID=A0AAD4L2C3_9EURO|nr:NAP family protein [Talaromyces proteolyticus]KAH8701939.1 NAP family protein [Talaromyces proteolyticus]
MSAEEGRALEDLISLPAIPKEAGRKITQIEQEFVRAEIEQLRKQIPILRPIYAKRNAVIASKDLQEADFWPRVFANAPQEVDEYILATDAAVIGQCLKNLTVERLEVDDNGNGGDPRSVRFVFDFATGEENPYFTNAQLVKDFYYRKNVTKSAKGKRRTWEGYVSAPVRINWKEDQDLTKGLLDATCDLYEAEQKDKSVDRVKLPEYGKLAKKLEEVEAEALTGDDEEEADDDNPIAASSPAGVSFFAWFGYRGGEVTAEQSAAAEKEELERWQKIERGEKVDDEDEEDEDEDEDDDEEEDSLEAAEVFPDGEDVAIALAEDLWPNALKYYVQSYEEIDDFDDEMDIEELDDEEDEDEDQPPSKKART